MQIASFFLYILFAVWSQAPLWDQSPFFGSIRSFCHTIIMLGLGCYFGHALAASFQRFALECIPGRSGVPSIAPLPSVVSIRSLAERGHEKNIA